MLLVAHYNGSQSQPLVGLTNRRITSPTCDGRMRRLFVAHLSLVHVPYYCLQMLDVLHIINYVGGLRQTTSTTSVTCLSGAATRERFLYLSLCCPSTTAAKDPPSICQ